MKQRTWSSFIYHPVKSNNHWDSAEAIVLADSGGLLSNQSSQEETSPVGSTQYRMLEAGSQTPSSSWPWHQKAELSFSLRHDITLFRCMLKADEILKFTNIKGGFIKITATQVKVFYAHNQTAF